MHSVPQPVELTGRLVRLEPLTLDHVGALAVAAAEDRATYGLTTVPNGPDATRAYVGLALEGQAAGHMQPYATVRLADPVTGADEQVVGSTRFLNIERWPWADGSLGGGRSTPDVCEIGATWLAAPAQRTGINVEAKLLMMTYAFETWEVRRISWRTDARNTRSRAGIEGVGATFEGVLRADRIAADGGVRDTACFSMTAAEWPAAKTALEARLARPVL